MSINKTFLYTIKLGHYGGKTETTKEYYSFNTFYLHGFRDKYGIISSTINKEFYRAIFLLSICWYNGGHLLIVNTNNKFSQLLHNYLQYKPIQKTFSNTKCIPIAVQNKTFTLSNGNAPSPTKKYKKKFMDIKNFGWRGKDITDTSNHNQNKISITSSKILGGTVTNWRQLAKSISRGKIFDKKFGKFITENNVIFPPYNKLKKSAVALFEIDEKSGRLFAEEGHLSTIRPDCILITGGQWTDILRDAFYLEIPTIVSVDSHTPVKFCTSPVWGNTASVSFISSLMEWFFRCSRTPTV